MEYIPIVLLSVSTIFFIALAVDNGNKVGRMKVRMESLQRIEADNYDYTLVHFMKAYVPKGNRKKAMQILKARHPHLLARVADELKLF